MFNNKSILISGGTGSFGSSMIKFICKNFKPKKLICYSRDELKQYNLSNELDENKNSFLRFFIGDVRDFSRLSLALKNVDYVIHAAALKQVPFAEYNPMEFIKTNVLGAENLVNACLDSNVKNLIALSTDKACSPINLYGATKLASDKLFIAANNYVGKAKTKFAVVRYGNVMGSRGSIIPIFLQFKSQTYLPITDTRMTRFNISLIEGVEMVLWSLENAFGGELLVPKIPSYRITDVAEAIGPTCEKPIVGIRPGEKIHEEMITSSDSMSTIDLGKYYAILPSDGALKTKYKNSGKKLKEVSKDFSYNSGNNKIFLSIEEIRELIRKHVDKDFAPQ